MINKSEDINFDDQVDLKEIFLILWDRKFFIAFITSIFAGISILYALNLPNVYTSASLLAPVSSEDSLSSKLRNFSSLGAISGVSLPSGPVSKSSEAIARIKSFEFFSDYFLPNVKLEDIVAVQKWDPIQNELFYNEKIYNATSRKWIRDLQDPKKNIPSAQEAFEFFQNMIKITEDKQTSFITISINHKSPFVAKEWVELIIYEINESRRKIDKEIAQNSILYLDETLETTNINSVKDTAVKLLESQMQTLMLTSSSEYYVLKIIDSPIVPEKKSGPSRSLICVLGTFFGTIVSIILVVLQNYIRKS